jgi:nucleotide-binding universal stress UspA family protein
MNTILTCTDGSAYAPAVYDHSAWAATRTNASVHVLHMLDPHREHAEQADLSGNIGFDTGETLLEELISFEEKKNRLERLRGKAILEDASRRLTASGVMRVTAEQRHGSLVENIEELEVSAELVVMGKRGESAALAKSHLGSNLERVIRASTRPILIAPQDFSPIERFLIAYDGGPSVEKAVQFALDQPLLKGLTCHLLRAGRIDANAEWFLQEAAGKLRAAGFEPHVLATPGNPEQVIADVIKGEGIQMLVMGAYGHSRIRQLILGSTTSEMIRTSQIPVLMFR